VARCRSSRAIVPTAYSPHTRRILSHHWHGVSSKIRSHTEPNPCTSQARWLVAWNTSIIFASQSVEWPSGLRPASWRVGMHSLQGLFACLKLPLPANDHQFRFDVLQLVCWLHQIRCRLVGINQTQLVYCAVWDEQQILSRQFHLMLFSDIEKQCHISRYYNSWL
jgi:hypothetical protein